MSAALVLGSIPSPESGTVDVGPFTLHMYGLTLLVAIVVATYITGRRWVARGGDWDLIVRCAVWGVAAAIVGARLYHIATSWNGGLGIWGGILFGCAAGAIVAKRAGADVWLLADCLAPALLVAQAIGRVGNWWNQELFGKPTDLPWGLEIDLVNRPLDYLDFETFHPTFLYEGLWALAAAGLLLLLERRFAIRPPGLFALYVALYCTGRLWVELLRIDPAHEFAGMRLNAWVSILGIVAGITWFVLSQRRGRASPEPPRQMAVPKGRVRSGR
jgi:prolipoprotein diacylglyceryl transferase